MVLVLYSFVTELFKPITTNTNTDRPFKCNRNAESEAKAVKKP